MGSDPDAKTQGQNISPPTPQTNPISTPGTVKYKGIISPLHWQCFTVSVCNNHQVFLFLIVLIWLSAPSSDLAQSNF